MAKSSDIIKIGFDYRASLEQFVKETNGVFDGISEKAGKQRISIQLDAKNDKVIEKIKELQKLKLDKFTFEFGESGLAEQLKTFDQLEKKITEIINLSKGINNIGSGNGIGNSIVDEKSLNSIIDLFGKMENHLREIKRVFADVGDGGEFSPLLSTIDKINTSIKELATSVKGIGLNMNIDVGSDSEMEAKVQSKIANALQAYQRLFDHIKMSSVGGSVINTNFFEFDINQYDTMMGKLQAYKKFIDNMRKEAKTQFNGKDVLYQDTEKSYWTQASAAMGQVTKAFNEMNAASDTNPLKDLFGSGDLSGVISQLGLIVAKLEEISTTASSFKNVFDNGFNVTASVEEIDKLTNRVKELEDELSKIKLNPVSIDKSNISSENNDLQNTIEALKQLSKLPGGDTLSLGKIMNHIADGAKLANPEVKKLLESLKLIDSEGKIIGTHINEGTLNSGVDLNDTFAIISRNDAIENVDKLIAKEKEAQQQGILLARTLASVDIGKLHYDIQELAQGSSVHQMKNSTLQQFIDETRVLCNATDEQILKLYSDAQKLSDLGFKLDLNPSNIRYDENSGFSFIDLELRKINEEAPQTVAIMHTLTQSLMGFMGQRNRLNWGDEENFYTKDNYTYLQNMLKTYERLQQIFSSKLSTPDFNQAFSDSLQLVKTRIADIEAHFENLGTPIKDVFQGDDKATTDASTTAIKEESQALEQVSTSAKDAASSKDKFANANKEVKTSAESSSTSLNEEKKKFENIGDSAEETKKKLDDVIFKPNTEGFDEIVSKLDIAKDKIEEISKITKSSVWSESQGEYLESYNIKYKNGTSEIRGESSNKKGSNVLRANEVAYDAKAIEQKAKAVKKLSDELEAYNKQVPKKPADGQRSDKFEGLIQNYKNAIDEAQKYLDNLGDSPVTEEVKKEWENLIGVIKKAKEEMDSIPTAERGSDALSRGKEIDTITKYLDKFTGISKQAKRELNGLLDQLQSGDPSVNVKKIHERFLELTVAERNAGREARNLFDIFKDKKIYSFIGQAASMFSFYDLVNLGREGFQTIRELDTALVDLKKTTAMNSSQLEEFYFDSNDVAKQMGVTTQAIIDQASAWSRLGYNTKEQATQMAELSSQFAAISPDMDLDTATDGLVSSMKAFDIEVSNVERDIMDNINRIGNTAATSNGEIVDMLTRSSAAMAAANNTIQETIALETAAVEITRNAETTGTAFKTLSMRIRGRQTLPPYTVMYMLCA